VIQYLIVAGTGAFRLSWKIIQFYNPSVVKSGHNGKIHDYERS